MLTFLFVFVFVGLIFLIKKLRQSNSSPEKCVYVVVLGDLGRSPRMCNHAIEFDRHRFHVQLIGYAESQLVQTIENSKNIQICALKPFPTVQGLPAIFIYALKIVWQFLTLFLRLCFLPKPDFICIQNPPSIPALAVTFLIAKIRGARLIIDWHNYGYSMLRLKHGPNHWIVRLCRQYEFILGRLADFNICVAKAFAQDLSSMKIRASVLYDKPTNQYRIPTLDEKHLTFQRMATKYQYKPFQGRSENSTRFTVLNSNNQVTYVNNRPAIVVSSTSWSEDENFSILFDALKNYGSNGLNELPSIVCIVTGKGPLKKQFIEQVEREPDQYRNVEFCFPWLDAEDYPLLLGCADLGVSLHQSSSGFDLPMKVVDMFAVGVPVCSVRYNCIDELVKVDRNGTLVNDAQELCDHLETLLRGFPNECKKLNQLKSNLKENRSNENWSREWKSVMGSFLDLH